MKTLIEKQFDAVRFMRQQRDKSSMKNVILLFICLFLYTGASVAQSIEEPVFTPEQLKEDTDYFFKSLFEKQPNPYEYSSLRDFENKKDSIYNLLNKPMTADEFMWIIGSINSYLSYHSSVNLKFNRYVIKCYENAKEQNLKLFPRVSIREGKIFTEINNQDREFTSINGVSADSILQFMQSYYNNQLSIRRNNYDIESFFAIWIDLYFNIKPPFRISYKENQKETEIEGISADEFMDFSSFGIVRQPLVKYAIYPSSSIAIFTSHAFNRRRHTPEEVEAQLAAFRDSVNKYDIKYLFLDLSKNTGGTSQLSYPLLDIVSHDTIFEKYSVIEKEEFGNKKRDYNIVARLPNFDLYKKKNKQLFVLQGTNTISAANYLCRLFKRYQLGILVGQPSGEPTIEFTGSYSFVMPNTKLNFIVAGSLMDFSEHFPKEEKDFPPDMYWDVDYTIDFEEKELIEIVKQWKELL